MSMLAVASTRAAAGPGEGDPAAEEKEAAEVVDGDGPWGVRRRAVLVGEGGPRSRGQHRRLRLEQGLSPTHGTRCLQRRRRRGPPPSPPSPRCHGYLALTVFRPLLILFSIIIEVACVVSIVSKFQLSADPIKFLSRRSCEKVDEEEAGFLSIKRAMYLDSVDVDLSNELQAPTRPILQTQVEAAKRAIGAEVISLSPVNGAAAPRWRVVPTHREQTKWDRAAKAATGGTDAVFRESKSRVQQGDPKELAARSRDEYLKLKQKMQLLTLGIGGAGVVSAYFSYTPEIAASFGAGLVGSLIYLRMLGTSVDSLAGGTGQTVKSVVLRNQDCSYSSGTSDGI